MNASEIKRLKKLRDEAKCNADSLEKSMEGRSQNIKEHLMEKVKGFKAEVQRCNRALGRHA